MVRDIWNVENICGSKFRNDNNKKVHVTFPIKNISFSSVLSSDQKP